MVYLRLYDIILPFNAEVYLSELQKIVDFNLLNIVTLVRLFIP